MGDFGVAKDKWVCPNDRELALRAKLKTGWSVKTSSINSFNKPEQLNDTEQEVITNVIKRAEHLERIEQERIGRLVEKLENMKKNAMGNGATQCILCADEFGLLGASPLLCNDCKKAVCTKCGVDTVSSHKEPVWLCKICAETREMWKKSGAWFFRGLPKYVLPEKKNDHGKYGSSGGKVIEFTGPPSFNTWSQGRVRGSSEREYTDSSDDELKAARFNKRQGIRKTTDSVDSSDSGVSATPTSLTGMPLPDTPRRSNSPPHFHSSFSTTEGSYEDIHADHSDSEMSTLSEGATAISLREQERDHYKPHLRDSPDHGRVPAYGTSAVGWHTRVRREADENAERAFLGHLRQDSQHSVASDISYTNMPSHHTPTHASIRERDVPLEDASFEDRSPDDTTTLGTLEFSLLYDTANQALHCTIYRAKGLRSMDCNGLSDPYVKLQLLPSTSKSDKLRTRTVHKTLNPEFNETVIYYDVTKYDIAKRTLRLTVLDEDPYGHDFIGEARVSLKRLRPHQTKHFNVYLDRSLQLEEGDEDEIMRGQILLSLMFSNNHHALIVGIVRCIHLPARDTNGYSDPFVKIQLKPDPLRRRYKTSVKKKTLNPEFHEEFVFEVKPHEMSKKTLEITVWDKDYGKTDDYIGGLQVSIQSKGERLRHWLDTVRNPDRRIERWHQLSDAVVLD